MMRNRLAWALAAITVALHAVANPHYGFFRDELYFIICGRHPDWGYVDQPSLAPLLAAGTQLAGPSLFALRLVPAFCAGAAVFIGCLLVEEIGGGAFAQALCAICIGFAPVLASFGMKIATDTPSLPLWPLAALFVLRAITRSQPRWWIPAGAALGLAFNAKYSVLFFAVALMIGLLISGSRRALWSGWFLGGVGVAVALALPNALWQAAHGFPMWELLRNGAAGKNVVLSPLEFAARQVLILNPLLSIVWICGLIGAFSRPGLRWIGWTYVALIAMMIGLHAKDYYPAAFYPVLFATGAFTFERWTQRARWTRPGLAAGAVLAGAALIPFAVPVLPIDAFIAYQRALHLTPKSGEHMELGVLPQDYADMIGWPEMTDAIAQVYEALPPADRARAMIYTANYGEAAALDFFRERGLPPASSHHNQYYLWGPRGYAGEDAVVISINVNRKDMSKSFRDVRVAREYPGNPLAIPLERDDPILVSRGLRRPMAQAWPFTPKLYY